MCICMYHGHSMKICIYTYILYTKMSRILWCPKAMIMTLEIPADN